MAAAAAARRFVAREMVELCRIAVPKVYAHLRACGAAQGLALRGVAATRGSADPGEEERTDVRKAAACGGGGEGVDVDLGLARVDLPHPEPVAAPQSAGASGWCPQGKLFLAACTRAERECR